MQSHHSPAVGPGHVSGSLATDANLRQTGIATSRRGPKGIGSLVKPMAGPDGIRPKDELGNRTDRDSHSVSEVAAKRMSPPACVSPAAISQPAAEPEVHRAAAPHRPSFRDKYCAMWRINRQAFGRHLFVRCVPPWTIPFLGILWAFHRRTLANDLRLINDLAEVTTYREFLGAVETFTYANRESGFLREMLHIRISAKLILRFGSKLLRHIDAPGVPARSEPQIPLGNPVASSGSGRRGRNGSKI